MSTQETLFNKWLIKYKPYWPLFLLFSCLLFAIAFVYVHYTIPEYQATASLIIKDEKKGNDDSRLMESLNLIGSKKIIENEVEVLKSRPVIEAVVKKLHLYVDQYIKEGYKRKYLFENPILQIEANDPSKLKSSNALIEMKILSNGDSIYFPSDSTTYLANEWVKTPYGMLKFSINKNKLPLSNRESYFIELFSLQSKTSKILSALKINSSNKLSSIVDLKYTDKHPELTAKVLNEIISSYNIAAVAEKNVLAKSTLNFIEERLNVVGGQLNEIERRVQQYKAGVGAVDISTQGKLYLENVSNNDQRLSEVNLQLSVINSLEKDITDNSSMAGSHTVMLNTTDPVFSQMLSSLNSAELEREKLKKTVAENNPMLIAVGDQISKIKDNINRNIIDYRKNLEASRKNLIQTNTNYTSLLQSIPYKERELLEISRDQQIKSGIYSFLLQKREESELSYVSNLSDSRVVNYAQALPSPVSPNRLVIFSFAFILGWLIPVGAIAVKENFTTTILYRQEIEELTSLPVIGELAQHKKIKPLAIEPGKRSLVAEEFRRIRFSLQYYIPEEATKKILITSSLSGEGKSFVASNLAISFALSGKKVALVDFDLHNSSLEKLFVKSSEQGIMDYLVSENSIDSIIYPVSEYQNLFFIPTGSQESDPSVYLESDKLNVLMDYLDAEFDFVIIDSPPVALVSDAFKLSPYCAATIYVVRHGYTPKQLIKRLDVTNKINPLFNPVLLFNGVENRGVVADGTGYGYSYNKGYNKYYTK
jgi:capsular exopolysaccharide synthesis family protein